MHVNQFATNSKEVRQFCLESDILIIERNFFGDILPAITFWRVRNKPMMAVFDDAYHIITKDNPAYSFWHDNKMVSSADTVATRVEQLFSFVEDKENMWGGVPLAERKDIASTINDMLAKKIPEQKEEKSLAVPAMQQFEFGLKMMRGVQVPSRMLAEDWSGVNDTYHLPNYINPNKYLHAKPLFPKEDGDIIVGWHGSLSHVASFRESGVSEALEIIAKKYKNVKVYLGGDKRNYDYAKIADNKKIFSNFVPDQQWSSLLKSIDIAVAPLATEYDKRRSWIRGLEYMILQIPWIATNFPTYEKLGDYGTLIDNSVENWVDAISETVEHIEDYKEFAKGAPFEFAQSQSYDNNMEKNILVYEENINKPYIW
jgi:glycosyltransferase involved in cell wall biosynthesis